MLSFIILTGELRDFAASVKDKNENEIAYILP
jgi:hypothetical protein